MRKKERKKSKDGHGWKELRTHEKGANVKVIVLEKVEFNGISK